MPVKTEEFLELFTEYKKTKNVKIRNKIVIKYGDLVKYMAVSTRNIYQKYCETEDIVNEATLALINAIDTFDTDKNVKFETYASIRIRGAIIDYIRKQDVVPRSIRKFSKDLNSAYSALYSQNNREPTSDELSQYLDIPKDKLERMMADSAAATSLSFEEIMQNGDLDISSSTDSSNVWEAEKGLIKRERTDILIRAINSLKDQQKLVISLYYYEKLKFSDIAKVMNVSESRVCQIHSKTMLNLRYLLEKYINE